MWITLFIVTFFKTVTTHNSDDRLRHGVWICVAAPCLLGMAEYVICATDNDQDPVASRQCSSIWVEKYFIGIFIFLGLFWATVPYLGFFGKAEFGMGYWVEVFCLDTLAAASALFFTINGFQFSQTMQFSFLTIAAIASLTAFWHTLSAILRERGVFTPEIKWGPLSFMKLTHEALRGNLPTLRYYIESVKVDDDLATGKETMGLFAAYFNRFCIVHEEHSRHEEVIFKTFNDYFPDHARKWNDEHRDHDKKLQQWCSMADKVLGTDAVMEVRNDVLKELQSELPRFLDHLELHLREEEDHLTPIGRKYLPIQLMVNMSRKVWEITDAKKWEVRVVWSIGGGLNQMKGTHGQSNKHFLLL